MSSCMMPTHPPPLLQHPINMRHLGSSLAPSSHLFEWDLLVHSVAAPSIPCLHLTGPWLHLQQSKVDGDVEGERVEAQVWREHAGKKNTEDHLNVV